MIRLKYSEALQRKIRQDDPLELAIPTWNLVSKAIKETKAKEALDLLEYCQEENLRNNDSLTSFTDMLLTYIAGFGEEEVLKILRQRYHPFTIKFLSAVHNVEETLQMCTEGQRSHHGEFTITEEPDRYVARYDPCGTGGRLRRTRPVGTTKKAYPWSWGRVGVPYYCCHCCLIWEILATEIRGYPIRITLSGEKPEDPCIHLFYKKPELIPEEYFTRVGTRKTIK